MAWKILPHANTAQETGYWCGPASAQIVLSIQGIDVEERVLAREMFTDQDGTDSIDHVVKVLNARGGGGWVSRWIKNDPPLPSHTARLWADIVTSIDAGRGMVINIWAPANNHPPGYPNYLIQHYFALVGYEPDSLRVRISDPARFGGLTGYELTLDKLASLIPPQGYSAALNVTADPAWELVMKELVG